MEIMQSRNENDFKMKPEPKQCKQMAVVQSDRLNWPMPNDVHVYVAIGYGRGNGRSNGEFDRTIRKI